MAMKDEPLSEDEIKVLEVYANVFYTDLRVSAFNKQPRSDYDFITRVVAESLRLTVDQTKNLFMSATEKNSLESLRYLSRHSS